MGTVTSGAVFPTWVWVIALIMAVSCIGTLLAAMLQFRFAANLWIMRCVKCTVLALLALVGAELLGDEQLGFAPTQSTETWLPWWKMVKVGTFIASTTAVVSAASWNRSTRLWRRCGQNIVLLAVLFAIVGVSHWRLEKPFRDELAESHRFMETLADVKHTEIQSEGRFAETDAGRPVALERWVTTNATDDKNNSASELIPHGFEARVIVEGDGELDSPANCHGWVFTAGQYLIRGRYIDVILKDNKYRVVTEPVPGDLIVYRDELGNPIHTGIVKAVGDQGFVLIESKWGALDACLHLPDDQVYSKSYAYYRSSRQGHLLKGLESPGT